MSISIKELKNRLNDYNDFLETEQREYDESGNLLYYEYERLSVDYSSLIPILEMNEIDSIKIPDRDGKILQEAKEYMIGFREFEKRYEREKNQSERK